MKNTVQASKLTFDAKVFKRLKLRYGQAVANSETSFVFDGHELVTSYAKYLLEYLAPRFEASSDKVKP